MADLEEVHVAGEKRRLGLLPQGPLLRAWPTQAIAIPREQWVAVDLSAYCPPPEDQNGIGMCASSGTETVTTVCRKIAGLIDPRLSAGDLYRRVCGGRDQGSMPEDNLSELLDEGIATVDTVPYLDWQHDHAGAAEERKKYRGLEATLLNNEEHVAVALQGGFPVLIGYWHHSSDPVGADGWMDRPSGGYGGHAVACVGLKRRGDEWGYLFLNSWTAGFGKKGFAILPERRIKEGTQDFRAWALRATLSEPGDIPIPQGV